MKKSELKVGRTYYGKKNPSLKRKIKSLSYDDWRNCYWVDYEIVGKKPVKIKTKPKDPSVWSRLTICFDHTFAAWAGGEVKTK